MSIIDKAKLAAFNVSVTTAFNKALADAAKPWRTFAMEIQSVTDSENYAWLGDIPVVKEWVSDRSFQALKAYQYLIRNKDWEAGLQIDRNDLEDDKLGMYLPKIQDLAMAPERHYMSLIASLFASGFTALSYDGLAFFSTTHASGSNKGTGVLNATNFDLAVAAMMQVKNDEQTEYLDIRPTHLVVPPQLRATARSIVEAEIAASGASNLNFRAVNLHVEPRLAADATKWYLLDLSRPIKPFILQIRRAFQLISFDDERQHEAAFMSKKFRYSIDGRDNAGYGLHHLAWGSDGTV